MRFYNIVNKVLIAWCYLPILFLLAFYSFNIADVIMFSLIYLLFYGTVTFALVLLGMAVLKKLTFSVYHVLVYIAGIALVGYLLTNSID